MKSLYLLPGTMCDHRMWSPLLLNNKRNIEVNFLTISMAETIDEIVDDIAKQLPDTAINLLGFSLGGYLANAFALKYPDRIDRLFIVSNMPCALPEAEVKERSRTVNWIKHHGYRGIPTKRILNLLDSSSHQNDEIIKLIKRMDKDLGGDVLAQQLNATTLREDLYWNLPQLAMNKHFCVGDNDTLVSINKLKSLQQLDERMSLTIFPDTGHMLPLEKPNALFRWIEKYI